MSSSLVEKLFALEWQRTALLGWGFLAGFVAAIGVILEWVALHADPPRKARHWSALGKIVIFTCLIIQAATGVRSLMLGDRIDRMHRASEAALRKSTATANRRSDSIAQCLAQRSLSPVQMDEIARRLAKFKGQRFDVSLTENRYEVKSINDQIDSALSMAGWNLVTTWTGDTNAVKGVLVEVDSTYIPCQEAARALVLALTNCGLSNVVGPRASANMTRRRAEERQKWKEHGILPPSGGLPDSLIIPAPVRLITGER
jgi:uncharacterized protein (UPF0297 family)